MGGNGPASDMFESVHTPRRMSVANQGRCLRALFLDFDGVLHPPAAIRGAKPPLTPAEVLRGWPSTFEHLPILVQQLQGWEDVAVVVSSSWRMFFDDEQLKEVLLPVSNWYVGSTGSSYLGRSIAIRRWLELNEITEFAVLDDEPAYFDGDWPTLILCNPELGLGEARVQRQLEHWLRELGTR